MMVTASVNICRVSVVLLPNFTWNAMLMHHSNHLSPIFLSGPKHALACKLPHLQYCCLLCFSNIPDPMTGTSLSSYFLFGAWSDILETWELSHHVWCNEVFQYRLQGTVLNKILMTIILCMLQQQGDNGKVRTSAAPSASRQSTSTVTSSSVPAPSKPQTLSEEENMSNDGTQDSSKVRQNWSGSNTGVLIGKVIQKNQLDATIIYWSKRTANMFRTIFCPSSGA